MSTGKIITGLVAGLAAGAILGILFAPDKGTETRRKIGQKGTDLKNSIKSRFSTLVDDVVEEYENVKGKAGDLLDEGIDNAKDLTGQGKDKLDSWKKDGKHLLS